MKWAWQNKNWPNYKFDSRKTSAIEHEFSRNAGRVMGAIEHMQLNAMDFLKVELLSDEAISTSEIEGEVLQRDSVQSSIRKHLGLKTDGKRIPPNANGVSEMLVDLYLNFKKPLNNKMLFNWHSLLMDGRRDVEYVGCYRAHSEPMQIVSANYNKPQVYYEAMPSNEVPLAMKTYIEWFNKTVTDEQIPTLVFSSIAHVYFEMIHPFEDGNGRIGRALAEKALSMRLKHATLNSLSKVIEKNKKVYYASLNKCNTTLEINDFILFFSKSILEAQNYSYKLVQFLIGKTKFFERHKTSFNARQEKVLLRVFDEGIDGFKGGLSAKNYMTISAAPTATATRDLNDLVLLGALKKTGALKSTRYFLNLAG